MKNKIVKKTNYKKLVKKVDAITITGSFNLIKKSDYDREFSGIKKKTNPDFSIYCLTRV